MESEEIMGKILYEIKHGANYFRALEMRGLAPTTLTRYIPLLERDGLIFINTKSKKKLLKLNEARREEIERLINSYIEYEKREAKKKLKLLLDMTPIEEKKKLIEEV
ncbi:MAG: hypothetical protein NZ894_05985, partial [Archaeoglobaceae archaeon]|nr:hypothetical protein [Archaeoglobaceae archaeon]